MLTRRTFSLGLAASAAALCSLGAPRSLRARQSTRLAVVVARNSPLLVLSFAELKRAYLGEPVNVGGTRLLPLNRSSSTNERVGFDRAVLGMDPDQAARYWIDRRIRGQTGAPRAIDPSDIHQRVVARLEGAIGYVTLGEVRGELRVLRIDGKLPSDPGYPIEF